MIEILSFATGLITGFISAIGYPGIFILMALESTAAPVPSELVMPFAGYLVTTGRFEFIAIILIGASGSLFGSLASYFLGRKYGMPFIKKYGKYALITESDLNWTIKWFKKHGDKTIFISRFVPVVRHLISIPAGIARMPMHKFIVYTFIGATIWNFILLYAGLRLGAHWNKIHQFSKELDIVFVAAVALFLAYFIWKHHKRRRK